MTSYGDYMGFEKVTIGDATLYLGDSTELLKEGVLGDFHAIVSDPPYGVGYVHGGNDSGVRTNGITLGYTITKNVKQQIKGDDEPFQPQIWLDVAPRTADKQLRILLWGANNFMQRLPEGGTLLAWDKHLGAAADDSFTDCEWAWVGRKVKREVFRWKWKGLIKNQSQPLDFPFGNMGRSHVMQKPVELMRWCIEKVKCPEHGIILDPYMGSGSTLIAGLSLGYKVVGVEYSQEHFDVAVKRVKAFYGMLEGDNIDMFQTPAA
jgi:DNA modification methylase